MQAQLYWRRRQDEVLLMDKHTQVAACNGSARGAMGSAAVILDPEAPRLEQNPSVHTAKIGGSSSSFRAEAGAMFLAVTNADLDRPLLILTDSMNVISALQTWGLE
eukprot:809324-Rhodomonas_salina.1